MNAQIPDSLTVTLGQQAIPDCLKTVNHFGSTTYMNVCSGALHEVPWGGADWLLAIFLILLGLGFVAFLLALPLMIILDR